MISKNIFMIKVTDKGLAKSMITLKHSLRQKHAGFLPGCTVYLAAFIDTNYIDT